MLETKLPELIVERMKNFNISFSQAVQEIKEMFPQYSEALDKFSEVINDR